ncbi:transketolase-like [Daphnia pulicaria]|uniref:transketolase-like n=1 Tax=Daphnia pulicaria TaxID=35523 RepID=UPI001EEA1434|nr:transketolase-like [Daphnia pulicaria]
MAVTLDDKTVAELRNLADRLRIDSIRATNASKSGHPTSCASMAEIMSCLFFRVMKYKLSEPRDKSSDRFILSKGHAAPILYAAWAEAGLFPVDDIMNLRKLDSDLEGHPTPRLNFVDVATGSLGQGLSVACGMAYVGKHFDKASYRTYCLIGDGESAEGSIWEALHFAGHYRLDNLCAIFDINRLGQSEPTSLQHNMEVYRKRLEAFGFHAIVVDGHDVEELCKAFDEASATVGKPTAILAKTFKGYKFPTISDELDWHGKPLGAKADEVIRAIEQQMQPGTATGAPKILEPLNDAPVVDIDDLRLSTPPAYKMGEMVATRFAYGTALAKLAEHNSRVIALDGDTKNSTYSDRIKKVSAERYIECFIAEQNLVGVAIGAGCRNRTIPYVSTFAAFFTRAFDQLRMGAISQTNITCVGSHAGVSIGEDGPSQMALEDLAMFRSIPGSTVFYPSDAVSCERAAELAGKTKGICFIRTSRPNTAVIYENEQVFSAGKGHVVRSHDQDDLVIVGAGVTLHEALKASDMLMEAGIKAAVIDPFTIKPIDHDLLLKEATRCNGRVLTVEDHYPEGGLGEAVASTLAEQRNIIVKILAVREVPRSGPPEVLLEHFGIGAKAIAEAAKKLVAL